MHRLPFLSLLVVAVIASACGDDSPVDAGPDASGDAGICNCCGTDVLVDPGAACTDAVCAPYCGSDASPDSARPDGSMPDGSMDAAADATTDGATDGSVDATMDSSSMDSSVEDSSTDGPVFDALPDGTPPDAVSDATTLATGTSGCTSDAQCDEGVCWDFSDYDSLCGGTVCSLSCSDDSECISAATTAGATTPSSATCGSDGKCDFVGAGLGTFFCA